MPRLITEKKQQSSFDRPATRTCIKPNRRQAVDRITYRTDVLRWEDLRNGSWRGERDGKCPFVSYTDAISVYNDAAERVSSCIRSTRRSHAIASSPIESRLILVTNFVNGHTIFPPLSRQVRVLAAGSQLSFSDFAQTCPWPTYTAFWCTTPPHWYIVFGSGSKC